MPLECPPGFFHFREVVSRLGQCWPCGQGIKFRCLFPERHKHGDRNPSGYARVGYSGSLMLRCQGCGADWREYAKELALPYALFQNPAMRKRLDAHPVRRTPVSDPTAIYDYRDEDGNLLYQKLRYADPKRFVQRRPLDKRHYKHLQIPDDESAWVWGMHTDEYGRKFRDGDWDLHFVTDEHQASVKLEGCRYVLYRLPELLAAHPEHPVFLVEGEKDVETVRGLGFTATCTVTTGSVPDPEWFCCLASRRVVIIADNDHTGRQHAQRQAGILVCGGVRSLRVIWPGYGGYDVPDGGDITDWVKTCPIEVDARPLLIEMCKRFPEYRIW